MAKKVDKKKLQEFLMAEVKKINEGLGKETMAVIGDAVIGEMKSMISRGISPIEGAGRFPEYKAKKDARPPAGRRVNRSKRRVKTKPKGYPYSVQGKFPGKRPRPVNLFLSGKFLSLLKKLITPRDNGSARLEIGFEDSKAVKMEEGHRTGWLGQGKRATIPQGREQFAQRIQQVIKQTLNQSLEKFLKVKRR